MKTQPRTPSDSSAAITDGDSRTSVRLTGRRQHHLVTLGVWLGACVSILPIQAQGMLTRLNTFGGGDGWLAPAEGGYAYLGTSGEERGLAYAEGELILASGTNLRRLDAASGADIGSLDLTGVSGGLRPVNKVSALGPSIYACNLTTDASVSPFKVYSWATAGAVPTVFYSGALLPGGRVGDSFDVAFGPNATWVMAGFADTPNVPGMSGYGILAGGVGGGIAGRVDVAVAGAAQCILSFYDPGVVQTMFPSSGFQGRVLTSRGPGSYRLSTFQFSLMERTFSADAGSESPLVSSQEGPSECTLLNNARLLATFDTSDATVRVYNVDNPTAPVLLASANATSGVLAPNPQGTGAIAWGDSAGGGITLYVLGSNQGIQAFRLESGNQPPVVANPILDQKGTNGVPFSYTIPADTFTDPDPGQTLSYSPSQPPPGIGFDGPSRTFSGTPTTTGTYSVTVFATDNGSPWLNVSDTFEIVIVDPVVNLSVILTNSVVQVSWPASATQFHLQSATRLPPLTGWQRVNDSITLQGDSLIYTVPVNAAALERYYRLSTQ